MTAGRTARNRRFDQVPYTDPLVVTNTGSAQLEARSWQSAECAPRRVTAARRPLPRVARCDHLRQTAALALLGGDGQFEPLRHRCRLAREGDGDPGALAVPCDTDDQVVADVHPDNLWVPRKVNDLSFA